MKAILIFLFAAPLATPAPAELPLGGPVENLLWSILNKLLDFVKNSVAEITKQVEKLIQAIANMGSKLDPAIIKDLEVIVNSIVGLAQAGVEIANGVLMLCQKFPNIPGAVLAFIQAGLSIFQNVMHLIKACVDIIKQLIDKYGDNKQLDDLLTKLGGLGSSVNNTINQLQAILDKGQDKLAQYVGSQSADFINKIDHLIEVKIKNDIK